MLISRYIVLGREVMQFLARRAFPVVVATATPSFESLKDATGGARLDVVLPDWTGQDPPGGEGFAAHL